MRVLPIGASRNGRSKVVPRTVVRKSARGTTTPLRGRSRMRVEDAAVVAQRDFVLGAAVGVVEDDARQPALGEAPQVGDIDGLVDSAEGSHGSGVSGRSD